MGLCSSAPGTTEDPAKIGSALSEFCSKTMRFALFRVPYGFAVATATNFKLEREDQISAILFHRSKAGYLTNIEIAMKGRSIFVRMSFDLLSVFSADKKLSAGGPQDGQAFDLKLAEYESVIQISAKFDAKGCCALLIYTDKGQRVGWQKDSFMTNPVFHFSAHDFKGFVGSLHEGRVVTLGCLVTREASA